MVYYPADRRRVAPTQRMRTDGRGAFYPGEAAEQLGVKAVASYRQLQTLWWISRCSQGEAEWPEHKLEWPRQSAVYEDPDENGRFWTRFTLTDIACSREIIRLVGGPPAFERGRRPRFTPIANACRRLHELGIANPLLDVRLVKDGRARIIVELSELVIDAATGQILLSASLGVSEAALERWQDADPAVLRKLRAEASRPKGRYAVDVPNQLVLWAQPPASRSTS
jgi:hypothetical protein